MFMVQEAIQMNTFTQEQIKKITADTFEQLETYYRDANIGPHNFKKYIKGLVIRETGYMDATRFKSGLTAKVRYNIFTQQHDQLKSSFKQYGCWTFPQGCYFKVLDVYANERNGLVTLLQIPFYAVPYFAMNKHAQEAQLVETSRTLFEAASKQAPIPALTEEYWLKRTAFPLGIDDNGDFFYHFDYGKQQKLNPARPKGFFKRFFKK
jgi:hypothetical protein